MNKKLKILLAIMVICIFFFEIVNYLILGSTHFAVWFANLLVVMSLATGFILFIDESKFKKCSNKFDKLVDKYKSVWSSNKKFDQNRYAYNKKIAKKLIEHIRTYPEQRFIQILWNLNLIDRSKDLEIRDRYHEEPWITFKRMDIFN